MDPKELFRQGSAGEGGSLVKLLKKIPTGSLPYRQQFIHFQAFVLCLVVVVCMCVCVVATECTLNTGTEGVIMDLRGQQGIQ